MSAFLLIRNNFSRLFDCRADPPPAKTHTSISHPQIAIRHFQATLGIHGWTGTTHPSFLSHRNCMLCRRMPSKFTIFVETSILARASAFLEARVSHYGSPRRSRPRRSVHTLRTLQLEALPRKPCIFEAAWSSFEAKSGGWHRRMRLFIADRGATWERLNCRQCIALPLRPHFLF